MKPCFLFAPTIVFQFLFRYLLVPGVFVLISISPIQAQQAPGNQAGGAGELEHLLQKAENTNFPDSTIFYFEQALDFAAVAKSLPVEQEVLHAYANWYLDINNFALASDFAEKALAKSWEMNDTALAISDMCLLALISDEMSDFPKALRQCNEALVLAQLQKDTVNKSYLQLLIRTGEVFRSYEDDDTAAPFFERALNIGRQLKDPQYLAGAICSVAIIMQESGHTEKSLALLFEALQLTFDPPNLRGRSIIINNIGFDYKETEDYQQALRYYFEALDIKRQMGNRSGEAYTLNEIGETYSMNGDHEKGAKYCLQAMDVAQEADAMYYQQQISATLERIYLRQGDSVRAYWYNLYYHEIHDSLYSDDRNRELGNLEASLRYEKDRVDQEIALVKREQESERLTTLIFSLLGLVVLLVGGFFLLLLHRRNRQLKKDQAQQKAFAAQLISWQEEERKRVARELHDGLGQSLSIVKNKVLGLQAKGETELPMADIAESVGKAIQEVRVISHALRPMQLDVLGLSTALEDLVEDSLQAGNIGFRSEVAGIDGLLGKNEEVMAYRLVQESLNNILKHAAASMVEVSIRREAENVVFEISDDGKGFDPAKMKPEKNSGMGFKGMRERVTFTKGEMRVDSTVGDGTKIYFSIPFRDGE